MELLEAMKKRHSVRSYTDKAIDGDVEKALRDIIKECNKESGLNIQLCLNEPVAFSGRMARYGSFINTKNYIALVGKKEKDFEEKCGYYGEKIVLKAATLGLHTCWVGMTYSKSKAKFIVDKGEKVSCVISIGYGTNKGVTHKVKPIEELCKVEGNMPEWFQQGMVAVQLAPTAINQQKFIFSLEGNKVSAKALPAFYTKVDLGIAKYHFELGANSNEWYWE